MNSRKVTLHSIVGTVLMSLLIFAAQTSAQVNGKIAFTGFQGGFDIFTINSDGSDRTRLTNSGNARFPFFSPDGKKIAFYQSGGIYLMNSDGSNQTFLTSSSSPQDSSFGSSWSPDGRKIAFHCNGICIINADGSNRIQISSNPADTMPDWSPNGAKIAFTKTDLTFNFLKHEIYIMDVDGSNQIRLTTNNLPDDGPFWSPDGTKLAFTRSDRCSDLGGDIFCFAASIFTMNASDGSNQTFLTGGSIFSNMDAYDPCWSPDGTKIAFRSRFAAVQVFRGEIFVINASGGSRTNLTNTADVEESHPDWGASTPACPNPIDCAEFFVRQHYLDFLSREPDAGGLAYWTGQITQCGMDAACLQQRRIGVSAAFFIETEFQETGYFVYRLYRASYGTMPAPNQTRANVTQDEFKQDRAALIGGPDLEQAKQNLVNNWVQRSRFRNEYPLTLSNADFVNRLFDQAGLIPFAVERQAEIDAMNTQGRTRAQVLRNVLELPAFRSREYNPAFVLMQYFGYLGRDPDQSGYDFWLNVVVNGEPNNYRGMVCAFLTSAEYQLRFSSMVTRTNADCAP